MLNEYEYNLMEALEQMRLRYIEIEKLLEDMPEGSLVTFHRNSQTYYVQSIYSNGVRTRKYLSKDDNNPLVIQLKKKLKLFKPITCEKKRLCKALSGLKSFAKQLYVSESCKCAQSFPVCVSEKQWYKEALMYPTLHGEMVRSKSEVIICNSLYKLGIPYQYEKHWDSLGPDFCPDFTITAPINGRTVILEHLGLKDDQYSKSWEYKRSVYSSRNILEGRDLFITTEENIPYIDSTLAEMFTYKKYDALISFLETL